MAAASTTSPQPSDRLPRSEVRGLCATCINYPICQYTLRAGACGVLYCNEFDNGVRQNTRTVTPARPAPYPAVTETPPLAGLCANCELRESCTYPKPPGGVWHCNEYR
jgi:hypothetical protein